MRADYVSLYIHGAHPPAGWLCVGGKGFLLPTERKKISLGLAHTHTQGRKKGDMRI